MSLEQMGLEQNEWVELVPSGISFGSGVGRPVLILKDQLQVEVLPVWMHPLDAALGLSELSTGSGATPHAVVRRILEQLGAKVVSCRFVDLIGHHQYVEIEFANIANIANVALSGTESSPLVESTLQGQSQGQPQEQALAASHVHSAGAVAGALAPIRLETIRVRADEAMSFCLQSKVKFLATRDYMVRCRDLDQELSALESDLAGGALAALQSERENVSKKHPYVM